MQCYQHVRFELREQSVDRCQESYFFFVTQESDAAVVLRLTSDPGSRVVFDSLVVDSDSEYEREGGLPAIPGCSFPVILLGPIGQPGNDLLLLDLRCRSATEHGTKYLDAKIQLISLLRAVLCVAVSQGICAQVVKDNCLGALQLGQLPFDQCFTLAFLKEYDRAALAPGLRPMPLNQARRSLS